MHLNNFGNFYTREIYAIPIPIGFIPIPIPIISRMAIPIPMGFPWEWDSHGVSHSHAHLQFQPFKIGIHSAWHRAADRQQWRELDDTVIRAVGVPNKSSSSSLTRNRRGP